MKIYRLPHLADMSPGGEYLLGRFDLGTDAISILYGRLRPGGPGKCVSAGTGREALLFVVKGEVAVRRKKSSFSLDAGEAFLLSGAEEFNIEGAPGGESVYLMATGRRGERGAEDPAEAACKDDTEPEPCTPEARENPPPAEAEKESEFVITRDEE
ncbi:MAG: hypothetical protein ACE5EI_02070 [Thermodesulfobacteriota bacterium]